ncbi:MAG TPA: amidase family protein [Burkholderiaceae bacterium]
MAISQSEYLKLDATAMAALVRKGEVSGNELLASALLQYERVNPQINAINVLMREQALAQVQKKSTGLLGGVPLLIKDATQDYAGLPTSYGSRAFRRVAADNHSHIVQRFCDAGALIFGKTNTPELALKAITESAEFGVTRNPWDLDRTPGGSSGGSAAAVAAGIVPMAGANDGGGSIRIPAACCGLFGLRPSRGRVSVGPASGEVWDGASSDLVVSRSVRDTALALDLLGGAQTGDPFIIAPVAGPFASLARQDPGRLRIAFSTRSPIGTPVHPEAVASVQNAVVLLQSLGHEVVEDEPRYDGAELARCYIHMYYGQVAATIAQARSLGARNRDFEMLTQVLGVLGRAMNAGQYVSSQRKWNQFARALGEFYGRVDLYLTPTMAQPPIRHGESDLPSWQYTMLSMLLHSGLLNVFARLGLTDSMVDQIARDSLSFFPFTQLANLTGTPAMSVPLYWTPQGLPLGVQFCGPSGSEARLLQLATQLESAQPWHHRRPKLASAV